MDLVPMVKTVDKVFSRDRKVLPVLSAEDRLVPAKTPVKAADTAEDPTAIVITAAEDRADLAEVKAVLITDKAVRVKVLDRAADREDLMVKADSAEGQADLAADVLTDRAAKAAGPDSAEDRVVKADRGEDPADRGDRAAEDREAECLLQDLPQWKAEVLLIKNLLRQKNLHTREKKRKWRKNSFPRKRNLLILRILFRLRSI
jgi:hypothetical protein